jgi:hypothetical protein
MIIIIGYAYGSISIKDLNTLDFMGFIPHVTKIISSA